jgi:hypothetical protein
MPGKNNSGWGFGIYHGPSSTPTLRSGDQGRLNHCAKDGMASVRGIERGQMQYLRGISKRTLVRISFGAELQSIYSSQTCNEKRGTSNRFTDLYFSTFPLPHSLPDTISQPPNSPGTIHRSG